ncbi:MAG: hypothetical protein ACXWXR_10880 [Candidatus Limnocylindrales bacterium]
MSGRHAYRCPLDLAGSNASSGRESRLSPPAFDTVTREAPRHATLERVVFCCYGEGDANIYRALPFDDPPAGT